MAGRGASQPKRPAIRQRDELARPPIVTRPTRFELLWWITRLPSGVARMWRMIPTPDGIAQLWNFSVFGSNRTSASGRCPDSLYQTMSLTTARAYGDEVGPL